MKNSKFSITVYCGASADVQQTHLDIAHNLGIFIGKNNWALYYGGSKAGLMGAVAAACFEAGGEVHGISFENEFLNSHEPKNENLTSHRMEKNIHLRKETLHESADVIVVLPGGLGTLDEAFEALTLQYVGVLKAPIIFVNNEEFWNPLKTLMKHLTKEKFIKDPFRINYKMVDTLGETKELLLTYKKEWQKN
jgi:uncharacterized protein (TIGR00730 family)